MNKNSVVSRNVPCPCGSGKKYKRCCAFKEEQGMLSRRRIKKILKWIGSAAIVFLVGYGIFRLGSASGPASYVPTTLSGGLQRTIYYTEADIKEVDFSKLIQVQRERILDKVNEIRCTCGCGMTLAQCVAIDSTCPLRSSNIKRIRNLVNEEN